MKQCDRKVWNGLNISDRAVTISMRNKQVDHVHLVCVLYIFRSVIDIVGPDARKRVYVVYIQVRLKPVCSATENSLNIEILHIASLSIILYR